MLLLEPRLEQRLKGDDVARPAVDRRVEHGLVQLSGREGLIQTRPAPVPRLQLGARQLCLDFQHVGAEEVEGLLVFLPRAFEVKPDLEAAVTRVMPGFVMEVGTAEMDLHQAAAARSAAGATAGCPPPRFYAY